MVRIHYLDGQTINIAGVAETSTSDGVLHAGRFQAPLIHVRGWELVEEVEATTGPTEGEGSARGDGSSVENNPER